MTTPTVDQFLGEISQILREKNGAKLQDYLVLEPPLPPLYLTIVSQLRQTFPPGNEDDLEALCNKLLPQDDEGDQGGSWTAFISFLVQYFVFLRDVKPDQLVETHDLLKALLNQCILALSDASMGAVVLPTVISFSRTLARLAIGLDKRPELIAHLTRRESTMGGDEAVERVTLVESSANVIREAFKKCLSERSGNATGLDAGGNPEGRRVGIYTCANICLKLFFHCRKLRSAEQIFGNIYQQSPPLSRFPASQRVTYLYYLGRYHFANNHFFRAQLALQAAYDQCNSRCIKQRRRILVYLIASNVIVGRFPSSQLLQRPEAKGLGSLFLPLCQAIRKGDQLTFQKILDLDSDSGSWFLRNRLLFQLRNRCEVLVWRSLARKTFLISGFKGDTTKKAPSLDLEDLLALAVFLDPGGSGADTVPIEENGHTNGDGHTRFNALRPENSTDQADGEMDEQGGYGDSDLEDDDDSNGSEGPTMTEVESMVASLIHQDLLHGYISHKYSRFIITGAKLKSAIEVGFPNVWETICSKADMEVPGWVQDEKEGAQANGIGRRAAPGMVVKLSGARPAGAAPG